MVLNNSGVRLHSKIQIGFLGTRLHTDFTIPWNNHEGIYNSDAEYAFGAFNNNYNNNRTKNKQKNPHPQINMILRIKVIDFPRFLIYFLVFKVF